MTTIQWCVPLGYSVDISANVRDGCGIQRDSFPGAFARENIWCDVNVKLWPNEEVGSHFCCHICMFRDGCVVYFRIRKCNFFIVGLKEIILKCVTKFVICSYTGACVCATQ